MEPWCRSSVTPARMVDLVYRGLLSVKTAVDEWLMPDDHNSSAPLTGYIVSFAPFHECGLMSPPHRFLRRILDYYKVELHHLNPNGIQHLAAFVTLCEGYLGIGPHFNLWRYFFAISLLKTKGKGGRPDQHWAMGCAAST